MDFRQGRRLCVHTVGSSLIECLRILRRSSTNEAENCERTSLREYAPGTRSRSAPQCPQPANVRCVVQQSSKSIA